MPINEWEEERCVLRNTQSANGTDVDDELIACARKLLIYANTVVYRGTPWLERPAAA